MLFEIIFVSFREMGTDIGQYWVTYETKGDAALGLETKIGLGSGVASL